MSNVIKIPKAVLLASFEKDIKEKVNKQMELLGGIVGHVEVEKIVWTSEGLDVHMNTEVNNE